MINRSDVYGILWIMINKLWFLSYLRKFNSISNVVSCVQSVLIRINILKHQLKHLWPHFNWAYLLIERWPRFICYFALFLLIVYDFVCSFFFFSVFYFHKLKYLCKKLSSIHHLLPTTILTYTKSTWAVQICKKKKRNKNNSADVNVCVCSKFS